MMLDFRGEGIGEIFLCIIVSIGDISVLKAMRDFPQEIIVGSPVLISSCKSGLIINNVTEFVNNGLSVCFTSPIRV